MSALGGKGREEHKRKALYPVASVVLSELVDLDLGFITMLILEKQNFKIIIKKKKTEARNIQVF